MELHTIQQQKGSITLKHPNNPTEWVQADSSDVIDCREWQ